MNASPENTRLAQAYQLFAVLDRDEFIKQVALTLDQLNELEGVAAAARRFTQTVGVVGKDRIEFRTPDGSGSDYLALLLKALNDLHPQGTGDDL